MKESSWRSRYEAVIDVNASKLANSTKIQLRFEEMRQVVAELYFKGYPSRYIAEKLRGMKEFPDYKTVHHATISRDIATIKNKLALENVVEFHQMVERAKSGVYAGFADAIKKEPVFSRLRELNKLPKAMETGTVTGVK